MELARKTHALATLAVALAPGLPIKSILVVGCGDGTEAATLGDFFDCPVTAIDIANSYSPRDRVEFVQMDAREMRFGTKQFDFVYSFHTLEHVPQPERALREMSRVLKPGFPYCIGTPNRHRVIGYLGSADATLAAIFRWNVADWKARLAGKFRNECGAHAGFTQEELMALGAMIGEPENISDSYFRAIYGCYTPLIDAIVALNLQALAWPSVYAAGRKPA